MLTAMQSDAPMSKQVMLRPYCGSSRARREAVLKQATEGADANGGYQGMNNYVDYNKGFRREHTIGSEKGSGTEDHFTSPCLAE